MRPGKPSPAQTSPPGRTLKSQRCSEVRPHPRARASPGLFHYVGEMFLRIKSELIPCWRLTLFIALDSSRMLCQIILSLLFLEVAC
jgi:hypothetical protein